jgi:hypothetical protein
LLFTGALTGDFLPAGFPDADADADADADGDAEADPSAGSTITLPLSPTEDAALAPCPTALEDTDGAALTDTTSAAAAAVGLP